MKKTFLSTLTVLTLIFGITGQALAQSPTVLQGLNPAMPAAQSQPSPEKPKVEPPQAAPAEQGKPGPVLPQEVVEFFKMLMNSGAAQEPTPEMLENLYHQVWERIGATYHDHAALKNWGAWENKYKGKLKTPAELETALKEMVGSLNDRWTTYTTSQEIAQARSQHTSGIEQLGMSLVRQADGTYKVDFLHYGSPAQKSAVRKGDVIKSIGGKDLAGLSQKEVDDLLLVKAGDKVDVVLADTKGDVTVTLTSAATPDAAVEAKLLPGKIAYIRLPSFEDGAVISAFAETLLKMHKAAGGKFEGLVLDLRGNPGGQFQLAIAVSSLFLEKGTVVTSTTRTGRLVTNTRYDVVRPFAHDFAGAPAEMVALMRDLYTVPMSVITDGSTASSAEILTGALKDNDRARIVGNTTYGKGVGYQVSRLPTGGVLSITGLDYLTPSGYNLSNKGIPPHVQVDQPRQSLLDVQLQAALDQIKVQQMNPAKPTGAAASNQQLDPSSVFLRAGIIALVLLGLFLYGVHLHLQAKREDEERNGRGQ